MYLSDRNSLIGRQSLSHLHDSVFNLGWIIVCRPTLNRPNPSRLSFATPYFILYCCTIPVKLFILLKDLEKTWKRLGKTLRITLAVHNESEVRK